MLLGLVWSVGLVAAPIALAQEPPPDRPEPPPGLPGAPPDRPQPPAGSEAVVSGQTVSGQTLQAPSSIVCNTVHGLTINWGYGYEPKVPIKLSGPSWQTLEVSDDNGYYASNCLGVGIALINPISPPWLRPLTQDVAIRLGYWPSYEVNFGFYSSPTAPLFEVGPTMTVFPGSGQPGDSLTYTIRVTNTLGSPQTGPVTMNDILLTDLLPDGLTPINVTTTAGSDVEIWGNLVTVNLAELAPGQTAIINLTAIIQENVMMALPIINRASLIYPGHITAQTPPVQLEIR